MKGIGKATIIAMVLVIWSLVHTQSYAGFFFGEETKGVTITPNEADFNLRIRLQPRLDLGEILTNRDGDSYIYGNDLYLRRVRLEMKGQILTKTIKYDITLNADKWEQIGHTNSVNLHYAYLEFNFLDEFSILIGKSKLPYSRVSLTSSSKQLLIERPQFTESSKKLFGSKEPYYQPSISIKGRLLKGIVSYHTTIADGWQRSEVIYKKGAYDENDSADSIVYRSSPLLALRVELAPPGWVEDKKSDAHLGKGKHLQASGNIAIQKGIAYSGNAINSGEKEDRILWGFDISGHFKGFTTQFEYLKWQIDYTQDGKETKAPEGWYIQAGYFIDALDLNIEPSFRYEVFNQDKNKQDSAEITTTTGLNWYLKGHSLKLSVNYINTLYQANAKGHLPNDNKRNIVQVQAQMYF